MTVDTMLLLQVLEAPGRADLSAWVDFGALRQAAEGAGSGVVTSGPVTQVGGVEG